MRKIYLVYLRDMVMVRWVESMEFTVQDRVQDALIWNPASWLRAVSFPVNQILHPTSHSRFQLESSISHMV